MLCGCASGPELPEIPERETLKLDVAVDRVYGQLVDNPMDPEANGEVAQVLHRLGQYPAAELLRSLCSPKSSRCPPRSPDRSHCSYRRSKTF